MTDKTPTAVLVVSDTIPMASNPQVDEEAMTSINKLEEVESVTKDPIKHTTLASQRLPRPSKRRLSESLTERPFDLGTPPKDLLHELDGKAPQTVLYLAYGSNLCRQTFMGQRGIKPLSAVNVVVPELIMTFDLAGIPYAEPCFANTRYRKRNTTSIPSVSTSGDSEKDFTENSFTEPLVEKASKRKYHNPSWAKGLVGVVYEVTLADFAIIIATEGGGASYQDVLVDCYELGAGSAIVPDNPTGTSFKTHTLYSPLTLPGHKLPPHGRFSRPDPDYAQPSARYVKLITDGADEHDIPSEYKTYLHKLRPYRMTTQGQRIGASIFKGFWLPIIRFVFGLNRRFADDKGRAPPWLLAITGTMFSTVWLSYDYFFKSVFGDGERTIGDDGDADVDSKEWNIVHGPSGVKSELPPT